MEFRSATACAGVTPGFRWPMVDKNPALAARVQVVLPLHLLLVDQGNKETRIEKHESAVESGRRHANDGVGMLVHLSNTAHDTAVVLKTSVPIVVAENDVGGAVGAVLIGGVKETTERRLKAEYIEVIPAC